MQAGRPLTDREIAGCFNVGLGRQHRVRLVGGACEPEYLPENDSRWAVLRYSHDFARSALHELAHWCIAGRARRKRVDFGYRYQPPPRTQLQHESFVRVEIPVQALELLLCTSCHVPFRVSVDDVADALNRERDFADAVADYAQRYIHSGLPPRGAQLLELFQRADFGAGALV